MDSAHDYEAPAIAHRATVGDLLIKGVYASPHWQRTDDERAEDG